MELTAMKLDAYLELVASNAPAPGGGSASALMGAQGIGLAAMAARLPTAFPCAKHKSSGQMRSGKSSLLRSTPIQKHFPGSATP